jgi:hypothetical protein
VDPPVRILHPAPGILAFYAGREAGRRFAALALKELLAKQLKRGDVRYFEPYEEVHRENLAKVL